MCYDTAYVLDLQWATVMGMILKDLKGVQSVILGGWAPLGYMEFCNLVVMRESVY